MFEFLGGILEALTGYIAGRYTNKGKVASHFSALLLSLICGVAFFVIYAVYEVFFPAPNPMGNIWIGLLGFSALVATSIYLILLFGFLFKQ